MTESTREIAHRLIARHQSVRPEGETNARAAASAGDALYRELSRWVGADGSRALFVRAIAEAHTEHPELAGIHLRARSELHTDNAEFIIAKEDEATEDALESILMRLVELLGRLIGDDMALKLIERSLIPTDTTAAKRRQA